MSPPFPFDEPEFRRWLVQADHTLASARRDLEHGDFVWACFKAQQAAEYAVKGLARALGIPAFGHAVSRLLKDLAREGLPVPPQQMARARLLDRHYIPPRYPDAYTEGAPLEYYDEPTARGAIDAADQLILAVKQWASEFPWGPAEEG